MLKKKMNKKETLHKILEKVGDLVGDLSDNLELLRDEYEQAYRDLEYLKFRQHVKGNMLVTFSNLDVPDCVGISKTYIAHRDEYGEESLVLFPVVRPKIKYLEANQVVTIDCKDVIAGNIYKKVVATSFPNNQHIIKLVPKDEYYKCKPVYLFADLRKNMFEKLDFEKCQELGINIDKDREWVEI